MLIVYIFESRLFYKIKMFIFVKNQGIWEKKLLRLMKSEGLTCRLAEILGTGASNISHIISGRSKPGYDLLRKILLSFPQINPDWLLLDDENNVPLG